MFELFIKRPILSTVISVIITALGFLALLDLPITQFPAIEPPSVTVTANYTGANAEVCAKTVATPVERAINGVPGMTYMSTVCSNNGITFIQVFFESGTDPDLATVNVQNRVTSVLDELPEEVIKAGVITEKEVSSMLMYLNITSSDSTQDEKFVYNFADINILHELKRINGVGFVEIMGARDYAMRVWLKPDRMTAYNISAQDVVNAIQSQNVEAAPGATGISSDKSTQLLQYVLRYTGKFTSEDQYENIVVKSGHDGSMVRIRDVAEVEFGSLDYDMISMTDGRPSASIMIKQRPGSNAREVIQNIKARMAELKEETFPPGMDYNIAYDVSRFLDTSINEVVRTLVEAFILVFIVVFIFLQDFRSTLIPAIAVPVSLIGTFFFMNMFGFSINLLTLFALVLAIGIVVDNAIVVVEAVHVKMHDLGMSAQEAAIAAIREMGGAIVAITLVMSAVFIPVGFLEGPIGVFYRQFSLTLAIAIVISGINALTLSPALCAMLLRENTHQKKGLMDRFFRWFNRVYGRSENKYRSILGSVVGRRWLTTLVLILFLVLTLQINVFLPTSFIPTEDQGMIYVNVTLPAGATLERTQSVLDEINRVASTETPIESISTLAGYSLLTESAGASFGMAMINLRHWHERDVSVNDMIGRLQQLSSSIHDAEIQFFPPPAIPGFGNASGFELRLQDRTGGSLLKTSETTEAFVAALNQRPELQNVFTNFNPNFPQFLLNVDHDKAVKLGVSVREAMDALQTLVGSFYASNFIRFGQMYKVMVQTSPDYRSEPNDILNLYVKNSSDDMVPCASFMTLERVYGPEQLTRYNMFTSSMINGEPAPGYSSGDAIAAVEETAEAMLPRGYTFDWSGVTREEIKSGNQTLAVFMVCLFFVYLLLAAQYESYILPFPIVLSLPAGVFGSYLFLWATGLENNVYAQVALVMLIGLLAKNAILIVEFAIHRRKEGATVIQAAIEGAVSRLRPILMTSFAFIAGLIPLCIATGAGAIGNRSIGTAAAGGMLTGTLFGIFLVPGLYVIFESIATRIKMKKVVVATMMVLMVTMTSCKLTSEVSEPSLTLPDSYFGQSDTTDAALTPWSFFYSDSSLVHLIETALENNRDLRMSADQLKVAFADYKMQSRNYLPALDVTATNALKKFGDYTMDGVGNEDTNESERVPQDKKIPMNPYREWYGGIGFSWEADIWGKLFSQRKAAMARYMASNEYRHGVYTWLIGEVATNYFELMGLDQEKKVLQENLRLQELGLEMMQVQKAGGNVNQLAVDQFEAQLLNVKSQLVGVDREIIVTEARINELLGRFPHHLVRDSISDYDDLQLPHVGMPEHLLKRRPDIRQAELELEAANWDVNVARAAFYPSLQINGIAGFQSFDFSRWLSPASAAYNIATGISAPLFHRRQVRAMYEAANARQRVLLNNYEKSLLTGYYEVYTTITTFKNLDERIGIKRLEAEVLRQAYNNANDLFSVGYATYLEVITAQRRMLEVELEFTRLKKQKLKTLSSLYRALGGGWESN